MDKQSVGLTWQVLEWFVRDEKEAKEEKKNEGIYGKEELGGEKHV